VAVAAAAAAAASLNTTLKELINPQRKRKAASAAAMKSTGLPPSTADDVTAVNTKDTKRITLDRAKGEKLMLCSMYVKCSRTYMISLTLTPKQELPAVGSAVRLVGFVLYILFSFQQTHVEELGRGQFVDKDRRRRRQRHRIDRRPPQDQGAAEAGLAAAVVVLAGHDDDAKRHCLRQLPAQPALPRLPRRRPPGLGNHAQHEVKGRFWKKSNVCRMYMSSSLYFRGSADIYYDHDEEEEEAARRESETVVSIGNGSSARSKSSRSLRQCAPHWSSSQPEVAALAGGGGETSTRIPAHNANGQVK
jgi:hypothetical protein